MIVALINSVAAKVGTIFKSAAGAVVSASTPIYIDSNSQLAAGGYPFPVQLFAGVTNSGFAVASIQGRATGTANDLMHLTLVSGANATATVAGYYRISVTDDAGVITTGDYYAPFYTLA